MIDDADQGIAGGVEEGLGEARIGGGGRGAAEAPGGADPVGEAALGVVDG